MLCASCGHANPETQKFCGECGSPLSSVCPSCATVNAAGQKFCGECGTRLGGAPAGAEPQPGGVRERAEPEVERRLVSVLFADLVGFTSLSEGRDAEEVRELLSAYFDTCRRLIGLYGGTVEKFIGDAVMAVWGTPTATEDDAERAVRAALDLVAAISSLGDELGADGLRARAGVLTGEAAVTLGAEGEGMVAGDLVNTASRIQSAAEPGSVLVGESTRRTTERAIVYEEAGTHALKGKDEPVTLWRAVRVVSGMGGELRSEGLEAPFVGRDRELRQIKELFHACAEERRASLVSVTGIAGIGKSRLGWEFYKYLNGIVGQVWWHRGRCLAYGEGVTYWALADMVRMRCRIAEDEEPVSARRKLQATLVEHVLDPEERAFVEPRVAQLLGIGDGDVGDRAQLFAAWRLFFERIADSGPVALLFEDLQWADSSLLDFVEHLLEWSRDRPLFVLTHARPELLERRPTWGAGQRQFASLYLEPLGDEVMRTLLDGLVPGLPEPVVDEILARAEGVPLYAVETVRMLLDRGVLVEDDSVYRVVGEIETLEVPETLHALIAARLDALSDDERRVVQHGAVLGKTFAPRALAAITAMSEAELEPLLASLVRKEVLGQQSDPRSPELGQYGFLQDLVRKVAYETLARGHRKALHLAAADELAAALGQEDVAEVIAAHLVAACELEPDAEDAAELRGRARDALTRAGERAATLAAAAEAQRYFERAADLADPRPVRADLLARAGEWALRDSSYPEARVLLEEALDLCGSEVAGVAVRAAERLAMLEFHEGQASRAVELLEQALSRLGHHEPTPELAAASAELGRFLALTGEPDRAWSYVEQALGLAEALELPETLAGALNTKAGLLASEERRVEAELLYRGALAVALEHEIRGSISRAYGNFANYLEQCDRFAEVVEVCDRRLEHERRSGNRSAEGQALAGPIGSLFLLGRWDEALARAEDADELMTYAFAQSLLLPTVVVLEERGESGRARELIGRLQPAGDIDEAQTRAIFDFTSARVLRADGRYEEALAAAERAFAIRDQTGISSQLSKWGLTEALEAAMALGDAATVRRLLGELDAVPSGHLTPLLRAQQARFRARLGEGDPEADFMTAEQRFRELGTPFYLAVTLLEHGERLIAQGRTEDAGPRVAQAREIFGQLGARPWLERAAALAGAAEPGVPA